MGVIDLNGLEVRLGTRTVLDGLTGELQGHAIGLLGPNGAGKSTLINTLLGFHPPSKGSARVLGLDAHRDRAQIRGAIGYMPENDSFIGNMTGVRFVRYMAVHANADLSVPTLHQSARAPYRSTRFH